MEFRVLGPLEVHDGSRVVPVPGAKERTLLADLLVNAGRVVPANRLIDDVWGDDAPGNPGNALQGRVSQLRRALGPAGAELIVTRPPGYVLDVAPTQVDAARFERLAAEGRQAVARGGGDPSGLLARALALWRGPALAEFTDAPFARAEAARLEELRLSVIEARADLELAAGRHDALVSDLEAVLTAHPYRERLRGQLMLALYRSGRQADALRVYDRARTVLADELGVDPSPQLQQLHRRILTQDTALAPAPAPAGPRHNLPARVSAFIGREAELREAGGLLARHRLLTITGPGGAGKTSLAVELARRQVDSYGDGVWFVTLAGLRDPALLGTAVSAALPLGPEPAGTMDGHPAVVDRLTSYLRDKHLLLVVDNAEHLVDACAELIAALLHSAPGLTVMVTSREVLGIAGEAQWAVPPLASDEAVELFAERARMALPGFDATADGAAVVAEICRRLDGIPLAIELAAARVHALPLTELAARLDDRFRLLGGRRTVSRHATLQATVDWSWELLDESDRRLFRRLAVFAGGWTIAAAEAVCGAAGAADDVLGGILRLVDRSLVVAAGGQPARFRMLETLRAYGRRRLAEAGEADTVTRAHAIWFRDLAERAARHHADPEWLRVLHDEYDNLRAALDAMVETGDGETMLRLAGALGWYWSSFHHDEGRRRLTRVLDLVDDDAAPTSALAGVLQAAALIDAMSGATPDAGDRARRSVELFERVGDRAGAATSKLWLALTQIQQRGSGDVVWLVDEADAVFHELDDRWGQAVAWLCRFMIDAYHGLPDRVAAFGERALERFRALGDLWGITWTQFLLGGVARTRGDLPTARRCFEDALAIARAAGPTWIVCAALIELGSIAALDGDTSRAAALHEEAVAVARRSGMSRGLAHAWNEMALAARVDGDVERARRLHADALAIHRELVRGRVPRTLAHLACAEARAGALDAAEAHLREAATSVVATPQPLVEAVILVGFGLVAIRRGEAARAALLLGAADTVRARRGVTPIGAERVEAELVRAAARRLLGDDVLRARLASGGALPDGEAVRVALR